MASLTGYAPFHADGPRVRLSRIRKFSRPLTASSPSPSVGVCSDQRRKAAKIGSVLTDGDGDIIHSLLQRLRQREGCGKRLRCWRRPGRYRT
jgi:hypothetical protein